MILKKLGGLIVLGSLFLAGWSQDAEASRGGRIFVRRGPVLFGRYRDGTPANAQAPQYPPYRPQPNMGNWDTPDDYGFYGYGIRVDR